MVTTFWVGLDVGEENTNVCVLDQSGQRLLECSAGSSAIELAESLSQYPVTEILGMVMESGASINLPRQLSKLGYPVSVLNARRASKLLSLRNQKTDVNDARGLADIARLGGAERLAIHVRRPEAQQIRTELALRHRMVWLQTAAKNSLRSMLRSYGSDIKRLGRGEQLQLAAERELKALASGGVSQAATTLRPLIELCGVLHASIRQMDKALKARANAIQVTRRFMEIPGVGPLCALSFYSMIDEPSRFRKPVDIGPYLGMVPALKQSGKSLRRSGITRAGDRLTRSHLVLAAGVMMSRAAKRCALSEWGTELARKSGYGRARLAVARKLAVVMLTMWQTDRDFECYPAKS